MGAAVRADGAPGSEQKQWRHGWSSAATAPGTAPNHAPQETSMKTTAPFALQAALLATLTLAASAAFGQMQAAAVRSERNMSLDLANQLAGATVAACAAGGHNVTAAVVDRAGQLRALHRADQAGPHTIAAAQAKAYTSASARNTTLAMMEGAQKNPAAANLTQIPGFLLLGGGVPVKAGNDVIGAIGVGGAPGGHLDEQCALAALDKARESLK
jgi:uncharacterized protein GlcG (DUF336 family)